jgi:hypothetical protein
MLILVKLYLWRYSPLLDLGRFFSFLVFYTVGRIPWTGDQPVARPLPAHKTTQTQKKHTQASMPLSGIRTHVPSICAGKDSSCRRPRGHCDRHIPELFQLYIPKGCRVLLVLTCFLKLCPEMHLKILSAISIALLYQYALCYFIH